MKKFELVLRIIIAIVIGEILLVLGTTLAQEVIVDGVSWYSSSKSDLIIGGSGSFLAAVISGVAAFSIVKQATTIPIWVLSLLVVIETTWLIQTGRTEEPIWFSVSGSALLILGFWVGKLMLAKLRRAKN